MNDAKAGADDAIPVAVQKKAKGIPPNPDCSADILQKLEREPGDRVTCVRVFDDFYRCNWWAIGTELVDPRMLYGSVTAAYRVRKSRFVRATLSGGSLVVEDATRVPLD